jgi:adenosine deaminase
VRPSKAEIGGFVHPLLQKSHHHGRILRVSGRRLRLNRPIMSSTAHNHALRGAELIERVDIRKLPKVLLHEHLDGGLRPATVIELAADLGYPHLPTSDPVALAAWFHRGAQRGNLPEYLEGFQHTTGVMQTAAALERVAFEFIEDMHADGVVYAEVRFAPVYHTDHGLTQDEVVAAVVAGLRRGEAAFGVKWGLIICAMRHLKNSLETAELAIRCRDLGVVGFDLAGGEDGFPPKKHVEAFQAIERANFYITIHAGEAYGPESIWQALQYCGAHRLGHATRLRDDIEVLPDGTLKLGRLAQYILDRRVPLEMCLLSNLHTGACRSLEEHPFGMFFRRGFRVCLNTDDRLMSDTSMTKETTLATRLFNLSFGELEKLSLNAMKSAFTPFDERLKLIYQVIKPGFAKARARLG